MRARATPKAPAARKPGTRGKAPAARKASAAPTAPDTHDANDLVIYLLRHADAGDAATWEGDDAERPLSKKGRKQARALGKFLATRDFNADVIVTSPKLRALETALLVAKPLNIKVAIDDLLARSLDLDRLGELLESIGTQRTVLVGHDPDFSQLAASLTGTPFLPMKKGAIARIDLAMPLHSGGGLLRWLITPELLGGK